jgi:hypothetical protein
MLWVPVVRRTLIRPRYALMIAMDALISPSLGSAGADSAFHISFIFLVLYLFLEWIRSPLLSLIDASPMPVFHCHQTSKTPLSTSQTQISNEELPGKRP